MTRWNRREFIQSGSLAAGAFMLGAHRWAFGAEDGWNAGPLRHVLPLCNHDTFLLKTSFIHAMDAPPVLRVDSRRIEGEPTDTTGRFWRFFASGLEAERSYTLQLEGATGETLTDPWPLKTFPHPESRPEHFRLAVYTCAGGSEGVSLMPGQDLWIPIAQRARLFDRMLSYAPHAVIGVGDQVYWDQLTGLYKYLKSPSPQVKAAMERLLDRYGAFDRAELMLGTHNETVLTRIVDEQLAGLYGVRMRSVPVMLTQDDHDYFENDEADDRFVSFPPDDFMMRAARATQRLYFPEFLPDPTRPGGLGHPGGEPGPHGLTEAYGTVRYGTLFEGLLYDCRRFVTMHGPTGVMVARTAEDWLLRRMAAEDAMYTVNIPSTPFGWTAGKWGEWYPDVLQEGGELGTDESKPHWQEGWFRQHQRIVRAAGEMKQLPLFISGDLHAIGNGVITRSGDIDLSGNPVVSVLSGPISSAGPTFASEFRGVAAAPSGLLEVQQDFAPIEKNGFTIFDFTPEKVTFRQFSWRGELGDPVEAIAGLEPFHEGEFFRLRSRG